MTTLRTGLMAACVALMSCAAQDEDTQTQETELKACLGLCGGRIQAGANLLLLGVTDDHYALYRDGDAIYSTRLIPGVARALVTNLQGHTPFVLISGKVAFIWTETSPNLVAPVSPLLVWTARGGAKLASSRSVIATLGVAASRDNKRIFFIDNANADATRGDLVLASADLTTRTTVLRDVNVDYNHQFQPGDCHPMLGFSGIDDEARPVAAYCLGNAATATLSTWNAGVKTDLISNVTAPPTWSSSANGATLMTTLVNPSAPRAGLGNPVILTNGTAQVLQGVFAVPSWSFLTPGGDSISAALNSTGTGFELQHRNAFTQQLRVVGALSNTGFVQWNLHEGIAGYYDDFRPTTNRTLVVVPESSALGLGSVSLVDLTTGTQTALNAAPECVFGGPMFTNAQQFVLYDVVDANAGTYRLHAGNQRSNRALSGATQLANHFPLLGNNVVFFDQATIDPANFLMSTGDLKTVDLSTPDSPIAPLATKAHVIFFPSHEGRAVTFTSETESAGPGLYVRRAVAATSFYGP